jgi:hypothetical protein
MIRLFEESNGGMPILFIRFNPDPYYYKTEEIKTYKGREQKLKETILGLKNRTSYDHKIGVIYLFYDGYTDQEIKIEPLEYRTEKGNLIINHKHPLSVNKEHVIVL